MGFYGVFDSARSFRFFDHKNTATWSDLVGFAVQLWMYAIPIVYPLSIVPEKWCSLYVLNPVVPIPEIFKHAFFSIGMPSVTEYGISIVITVFLLFAGIFVFNFV